MTLLLGANSPVQGFTDRAKQTALALKASAFVWLPACGPQDALWVEANIGPALHVVRLQTPQPGEDPDAYALSMANAVDYWRGVPNVAYQCGNEPTIDAGWSLPAWLAAAHEYTLAMKARFPGIRLTSVPLKVEETRELTLPCVLDTDYTNIHAYIERPHWDDIENEGLGASWKTALRFGAPIIVSEFGCVGGHDTNTIVRWAKEMEASGGVAAAMIFLLDGVGSQWASFDLTPEMATAIRAGLSVQPPPPPPPQGYTRDSEPMHTGAAYQSDAWLVALRGRNPAEADRIVATYGMCAAALGYDGNLMIAQGWVETAGFTSARWRNAHNAAGIGIYSDGTPDVQFGSVERGIQAQAALLSDYFGDGHDPWGVLAEYGFGFDTPLGKTKLSDLDGVWAADTGYSAAIVAVANSVTGGKIDPVTPRYRFVTPVDAPIIQGSDGAFSHGGKSPGFYAIDYGCPMGTPIRAVADGTVIYNAFNHPREGQTGHTICVGHADGYESRYCHLSEYDIPVGTAVTQGQIVAHSGAPDYPTVGANGYGAGAHLHFSLSLNNVWVKVEDLTAQGLMGPWGGTPIEEVDVHTDGKFDTGRISRLWDGPKTKAAIKSVGGYDGNRGIDARWTDELKAGHPLGFATSNEESMPTGGVIRYFSSGFICSYPDGSTSVN